MSAVFTVARLELKLGIRNRWILVSTLTLLLFALILVLLGGAPSAGIEAEPIHLLVASLATLSVYLLPLIALLLSFDSIAGEIDRGTLQLMLATPTPRWELLLGKFFGHLCVLAVAVTFGYGVAGAFAFANADASVSWEALSALIRLIGSSIVMGAAFIAIGLLVSACVRQTATAAALAILTWLVCAVLYDLALLGGLIIAPESLFATKLLPFFLLINPADAFRVFNMSLLDVGVSGTGIASKSGLLPYPPFLALVSPVLVTVFFLTVCAFRFKRIDP